ncbi:MAG: DUF4160 domain-containing protein [Marinirhabdus sp.]
MPTVLRLRGYRFFFYSNEHLPIHVHVENSEILINNRNEYFNDK